MATIYEKIKVKLEKFPDFRERRFRRDKLVTLALRDLGLEEKFKRGEPFSMDNLVDFASKYDSYRHEWDAVMRDNPDLQGTDYEDKVIYEQKKMIEFGYEPGYHNDLKQAALL